MSPPRVTRRMAIAIALGAFLPFSGLPGACQGGSVLIPAKETSGTMASPDPAAGSRLGMRPKVRDPPSKDKHRSGRRLIVRRGLRHLCEANTALGVTSRLETE
jgi:hypothetical protein